MCLVSFFQQKKFKKSKFFRQVKVEETEDSEIVLKLCTLIKSDIVLA